MKPGPLSSIYQIFCHENVLNNVNIWKLPVFSRLEKASEEASATTSATSMNEHVPG
jgi:hypothetical protein